MTDKELMKRKKQLLSSIKMDIKELEKYINMCSKDELKIKHSVRSKVFFIKLKSVFPFFVPFICSSCFSFFILDDVPFFVNDIKKREYIKTESDSFGNLCVEKQYDEFFNNINTISSYSAWTFDGEMYSRSVIVYYCDNLSLAEMRSISSFSDLTVLCDITEKSESVSSFEPYIKYTAYINRYYMIPESESHNSYLTLLWFLISSGLEVGVCFWREKISDFSYYDSIENIYREYLPNGDDISVMREMLSNKIDNYNLLVKKK